MYLIRNGIPITAQADIFWGYNQGKNDKIKKKLKFIKLI